MEGYVKPMILPNEEVAEGVFAASGAVASGGCYSVTARIHQRPELGRESYTIQVDGTHDADHISTSQILTISFNLPVEHLSSQGTYLSGNGTNTLTIGYGYYKNPSDQIGLGDIVVKAADGLEINSYVLDEGY
ncbi:MAG: hypothetical protein LBM60_02040 [Clostridium sp.]|jgi:hypothetical protein|nr:hypothetical protein [Clostridium sp.]